MFTFAKSFTKTFLYIIFGILGLGSMARSCAPSNSAQTPSVAIHSSGDCLLPGIEGRADWYTFKDADYRQCTIVATRDSFHDIASDPKSCALNRYDYVGVKSEWDFIVGRTWLIFPVRQREATCTVFLAENNWNELHDANHPIRLFASIDSRISTNNSYREMSPFRPTDEQTHKLVYRIGYSGEVLNKTSALEQLMIAVNDAKAKANWYGENEDKFSYDIRLFANPDLIARKRDAFADPICTYRADFDTLVQAQPQASCDDNVMSFWINRNSDVLGLSSNKRATVFADLDGFYAVMHSGRSWKGGVGEDPEVARFDFAIDYRMGIPADKPYGDEKTKLDWLVDNWPAGITKEQLNYILKEGWILQRWEKPTLPSVGTAPGLEPYD